MIVTHFSDDRTGREVPSSLGRSAGSAPKLRPHHLAVEQWSQAAAVVVLTCCLGGSAPVTGWHFSCFCFQVLASP